MKIKFFYPTNFYIQGDSESALSIKGTYSVGLLNVTVSFEINPPKTLSEPGRSDKYFSSAKGVRFEIEIPPEDNEQTNKIRGSIQNDTRHSELISFLASIINRMLRAVRNFGYVPHIQEVFPRVSDTPYYIKIWDVRYSEDGSEFTPLQSGASLVSYFLAGIRPDEKEKGNLDVSFWPDIAEAIQDGLEPSPEQEFYTNAQEFLQTGNLRMALIEACICLELVLSQYLNLFLEIKQNISKRRIASFLNPNLGLTGRVSVLLNLTAPKEILADDDLEQVLKAIKWRNRITHQTGRLPDSIPDKELRVGILSVLLLSLKLGAERDQISAEPDLQQISQKIATSFKIPAPTIRCYKHDIAVDVNFFTQEPPGSDFYLNIIKVLHDELIKRDKRFHLDEHLYVRFVKFPAQTIARWNKGKLEILGNPSLTLTPGTLER